MENLNKAKIQEEAFNEWWNSGRSSVIQLPPGLGKSRIAVKAIKKFFEKYPEEDVWVVVPTIPLKVQWEADYIENIKKEIPTANISVLVIDSAVNKLLKGKTRVGFIVLDEIHEYIFGEEVSKIFEIRRRGLMGLSGTLPPKHIGTLYNLGLKVSYSKTRQECIDCGAISDVVVYNYMLPMTRMEMAKVEHLTSIINANSEKLPAPWWEIQKSKQLLMEVSHHLGWSPNQVTGTVLKTQRATMQRNDFFDNHPKKVQEFKKVVARFSTAQILTFGKSTAIVDRLTECFPNISGSYHSNIADLVEVDGNVIGTSSKLKGKKVYVVNGVPYSYLKDVREKYPKVKLITSKTRKEEVIDKFSKGEIQICNSAMALQRGLDLPRIDLCCEFSRTSSSITFLQELGRMRQGGVFIRFCMDGKESHERLKLLNVEKKAGIEGIEIYSVEQINL